jgi:mRNA-degrading endonuclease YafQ of YafQ-DinJ toxin-antitoxin module
METFFSHAFVDSLEKYASIKKDIKKKVDMIIANPIAMGEPLKGNFRGFYSCPVKKRFLIIYLYCNICRKKRDDEIVLCGNCKDTSDDTIKFIALGPHDEAYGR